MSEPAATLLRSEFDVLTIGHSNLPAERFMGLLTSAGVTAIADVRSVPFSRRYPWFSAKTLAARLQGAGIAYLPLGEILGGRPRDPGLYRDGVADYEKMAATPQFKAGLDQVGELRSRFCLCLMCAEREPLDCHRCLLVGRAGGTRIRAWAYSGRQHDRAACYHRGALAGASGRRIRRSFRHSRGATRGGLSAPRRQGCGATQDMNREAEF